MTEEILEEEIIEPEDTRKDASDAELVELSTDIVISDEQLPDAGNYYYLENDDKSIGSFAEYKFCEEAIKAPEKIVYGYDGKAYFESQCPKPTIDEQNKEIRLKREQAYQETSDHLKQDYDEALARGEADADAKRILWLESKDKVRADNPYIGEVDQPTAQPEEVFSDNSSTVDNQVIDK